MRENDLRLLNFWNGIRGIAEKLSRYYCCIGLRGILSLFGFLKIYGMLSSFGLKMRGKAMYCFVKGHPSPVILRYGTSDINVFKQIFIEEEYRPLMDVVGFELVIDCGAYVGYSSLHFLVKCPEAHVIAVEPFKSNFDILQKNLSSYRERATLVHAAIYPFITGLIVHGGSYRDGREWTMQVRQALEGEQPDIFSVDVNTLIKKSGFDYVDLLKIDIERSEIELFSRDYKVWLNKVRNIVIELHDEECNDIFFKALSDFDYELSRSGELTICKNLSPKIN